MVNRKTELSFLESQTIVMTNKINRFYTVIRKKKNLFNKCHNAPLFHNP